MWSPALTPMYNLDPINQQARPNTVYVEGLSSAARIAPEQGRLLGLRAGQVINGIIAQRPEGNVLLFDNKALPLPTTMGAVGDRIGLQVVMLGGNLIARRLNEPKTNNAERAQVPQSAGSVRLTRLSADVGQLQLARFFSPSALQSLAQQPELRPLIQQLGQFLLSSERLQGDDIRRLVERSGLFSEQLVRFSQAGAGLSIKSVMIELRRLLHASGNDTTRLNGAIDEIEARQIETLGHQLQRQTQLSWLLPFHDQPPVFLQIGYDRGAQPESEREQDRPSWRIDMSVPWGQKQISLNVHYAQEQVSLKVWAASPEVAEQVQSGESQLRRLLQRAGVGLHNFTVFPGVRPDGSNTQMSAQRLNVDV